MNKLEKLTPQQEALMTEVREECLKQFFSLPRINKVKADEWVDWLYGLAGLKAPMKIYVKSPLAAQYAAKSLAQGWNQVVAQVGNQVWNPVADQVWNQVRNQVVDQVGDQVWAQVRNQVGDQVGNQVWNQVGDQVRDQVRNQVRNQVENQDFCFNYYGDISDVGWLSFYLFFKRIGVLSNEKLEKFLKVRETGIFRSIQLKGAHIASEMPVFLTRDEQNRMHNITEAAIRWDDGYQQHYIHGVFFEPELFKKVTAKEMSFKDVIALENIEQRMIALKFMEAEKLLESANAKQVGQTSERGNTLFLIKNVFSTPAYFLKYSCPSTGRVYVSGVDPEIGRKGNPDECMAWKHNLSLDEYNNIRAES